MFEGILRKLFLLKSQTTDLIPSVEKWYEVGGNIRSGDKYKDFKQILR